MAFWDTPAGLTALLAARSQIRVSRWEQDLSDGQQDPPWLAQERVILARVLTRLRDNLTTEETRPSNEDVDLAADIAAGRVVVDTGALDALGRMERAVAALLVMQAEKSPSG